MNWLGLFKVIYWTGWDYSQLYIELVGTIQSYILNWLGLFKAIHWTGWDYLKLYIELVGGYSKLHVELVGGYSKLYIELVGTIQSYVQASKQSYLPQWAYRAGHYRHLGVSLAG